MVIVEEAKCTGCGQCARICPEQCIDISKQPEARVAGIDSTLCSTCTQCIAICPQQALSWEGAPPVPYDRSQLPSPDQLVELLKQRRTIRYFRQDRLDRVLVEEIAGYGIYAPTNNYDLRAVLVDDPETIEMIDATLLRFTSRTYSLLYRSALVFNVVRRIAPAVDSKGRAKMAHALKRGRAFESVPAAMVLVVGDRRIAFSGPSAQYALYNMILYAQAKGIGSRIDAAGPLLLDRIRPIRARLGLRRREHILATIELGYPAVRFRNKVEGKTMETRWSGRRTSD